MFLLFFLLQAKMKKKLNIIPLTLTLTDLADIPERHLVGSGFPLTGVEGVETVSEVRFWASQADGVFQGTSDSRYLALPGLCATCINISVKLPDRGIRLLVLGIA